jgi:hypothetical protein
MIPEPSSTNPVVVCLKATADYLADVACPWRRVKLPTVTAEQRERAATSLTEGIYPSVETSIVPLLLLKEVQRVIDFKVASVRALEGKAVAQLGISGTVLGVLAAFGVNIAFAWKALPAALLLLSTFAYLQAIYARHGSLPSLGGYMTDTIATDAKNEGRIALLLAAAWSEYGFEVEQSNARKARFVRSGNFWLRLALLSLAAVVALAIKPLQGG